MTPPQQQSQQQPQAPVDPYSRHIKVGDQPVPSFRVGSFSPSGGGVTLNDVQTYFPGWDSLNPNNWQFGGDAQNNLSLKLKSGKKEASYIHFNRDGDWWVPEGVTGTEAWDTNAKQRNRNMLLGGAAALGGGALMLGGGGLGSIGTAVRGALGGLGGLGGGAGGLGGTLGTIGRVAQGVGAVGGLINNLRGGGGGPSVPNAGNLINQQQRMNQEAFDQMLNASRVDSDTPFGTTRWERGEDGRWKVVQGLSPEQQSLYNQDLRIRGKQGDISEGMLQRVGQEYGQDVNFANDLPGFRQQQAANFNGLDGGLQYLGGPFDRARAEQAAFNSTMRMLEPTLQKEEQRQNERLLAMGFDVNSEAYKEAMNNLRNQQGMVRANAADQAFMRGGQEATSELARIMSARQGAQGERMDRFSTGMEQRRFRAGENDRGFNQMLQRIGVRERDRARKLNELNAFRSGGQIQTPNIAAQMGTPSLQVPNLIGANQDQYNSQLAANNARNARQDNFWRGLMDLGSIFTR